MTLKSNAKFGEELTRHSKLAWGIWWILTRALENLTNSHFSGLLLNKVYIAWAIKSTEELSFKTLKSDAKFGEKLTCYFKIDIKNLTNFDPRIQKSKSLLLTGSFSRNYIFFEPRKVQRNYLSWHWRVMQNLEWNWLVISKLTWRIWQILTQALKSLKNFHLNRLLVWAKYILFDVKKYKGVIFHDIEEWCKMRRGIDWSFQIWHEEFDNFWPEHSKVSKIFTLMGSFWGKYMLFELNNTGELFFMTLKSDAKFGEKLTCCFKIVMGNLTNLDPSTRKSQTFSL